MTDLMEYVREARPTEAEIDRLWPVNRRNGTLARVLASRTATRRSPRRTMWLAAAAVAAGAILGPGLLDSRSASAQADLLNLARAASSRGGPTLSEGVFLHITTEAVQRNSPVFGDGETDEIHREQWVRWDGTIWAVDTELSDGWRYYHHFEGPDEPYMNNPTPEFAASLPDDPERLRAYLDEHVSGSSSHEEALFVAVADLARSHFMPAATLTAALQVLAEVEGVETRNVSVSGRPAVEITYTEFWGGLTGTESLTLDGATARVIREHESEPDGTYELTTTLVEAVDRVPAEVLAMFAQLEDGDRVPPTESSG